MSVTIYQVDAFAERPFAGNPAGVCILPQDPPEEWMQAVAAEMNVSETAFVRPRNGEFGLRWFTPDQEVDLCGHATLAAAHVLWETGRLKASRTAKFHTRSGRLSATRQGDLIRMDFPAEPAEPCDPPPGLLEALGVRPVYTGRNRFDYLLEVDGEDQVRDLKPDFTRLRKVDCRGVIVTAKAQSPKYDFVSRFFAPAAGVDEDPVTGSAHCCLAPYWAQKLASPHLSGFQVSRRGGRVGVQVQGERVLLEGRACTVLQGQMLDWREREGSGMESKSSYQQRMRNQFQEWGGRVDRILEKVERHAQGGYDVLVREIKDKRSVVSERLSTLEKSSGEAWRDLKPGLEDAWDDLRQAVEKAATRFRSAS